MIISVYGDMLRSNLDVIVSPVNCIGVAGAGLAKSVANMYPRWNNQYRIACSKGDILPGVVMSHKVNNSSRGHKYIISFPTKRHWKDDSLMLDIEDGLRALAIEIMKLPVQTIGVPALGCGLGALDWNQVFREMNRTLSQDELPGRIVVVFKPQ